MKDSKNSSNMDSSSKSTHSTDSNSKKDDKKMTESESDRSDDESKLKTTTDDKLKLELPFEEELLGSVTTLSSPAVRTSARVIQKLKMDSIRPVSPPISEKKDANEKPVQKTPNQPKPNKVIWTNIERNLFFEALNEYGKDFEAISHYVNSKQKRKNPTDPFYKTKENVRQIYHQTFHKVSKYLRFSDDIRKNAQELYALINYGEMRRKILFVDQKNCMKLKELVYKGSVTVRQKGKNIRIKTPSCKALRKLNQLEEWQEEIKLPSKVNVFLKPANIASWTTVQNLAQNPRIKTILPLQKRVISLLKTMQTRWRSRVARLCEQTMSLQININSGQKLLNADAKNVSDGGDNFTMSQYVEPLLCFAPPSDTVIHRPMVNLSEFLSSYSICLNSYEDRIGVSMKGETLCTERLNSLKDLIKTNAKRQRHDSGSEKKSPDGKRTKAEIDTKAPKPDDTKDLMNHDEHHNGNAKCESVYNSSTFNNIKIEGITQLQSHSENDSSGDEIKLNLSNTGDVKFDPMEGCSSLITDRNTTLTENGVTKKETVISAAETSTSTTAASSSSTKNPNEHKTKRRESKCVNSKRKETRKEPFRTLLSEEVIQQIKKGWTILDIGDLTIGDLYIMFGKDFKVNLIYSWMDPNKTYVKEENPIKMEFKSQENTGNELGNKLKQLLLLANMSEKSKKKFNCTCDRGLKLKNKPDGLPTSYISSKIYPSSQTDSGIFRQPVIPLKSGMSHMEAYKLNLNNSRNKQSRWLKMRNSRPSKQVVVQRLLPLQPGVSQSYELVTTQEEYLKNTIRTNDLINLNEKELTSNTAININNNDEHKPVQPTECDKTNIANNKVNDVTNGDSDSKSKNTLDTNHVSDITEDSLSEDPGIKSLMEISLPSPISDSNIDFIYNSGSPMSPTGILRESPSDPKWFDENVNDFSLSSFLGHLDSACGIDSKKSQPVSRETESSNLSAISESSIDYMSKFVELAQSMKNQE